MEVKVITAKDHIAFETAVNSFLGEHAKVLQIQFSTTQFGEGEIIYNAFITYE
jgi:hypothetical protein